MWRALLVAVVGLASVTAHAQWTLQDSGTTASLRGIHSLGGGVAWASGSGGAVLRTVDGGAHWMHCSVPDADKDGAKLDFRGVQAFDAKTAIVMSSGKGDLSRLYLTDDACTHWKLVMTNPDLTGFWDAFRAERGDSKGYKGSTYYGLEVAGDPVAGRFTLFRLGVHTLPDGGDWNNVSSALGMEGTCREPVYDRQSLQLPPLFCDLRTGKLTSHSPSIDTPLPREGEAMFAASNSNLLGNDVEFITGGAAGSRFFTRKFVPSGDTGWDEWVIPELPFSKAESAGAFSIGQHWQGEHRTLVVVGGDYLKPEVASQSAAYSVDGGAHWTSSAQMPTGYRSAVAFQEKAGVWITVGPNGTDVATDDGRNWRPLKPGPGDAADADKNWNALSLPFVVGAKGRIGVLRDGALGAK